MAIENQLITLQQRDLILISEENHFFDIKSIDIEPSKLTQSISAFANSDGGEIYIGIDEVGITKTRKWRGFSNMEAANSHIQVFDQLFPLGKDFQYTFLRCEAETGLVLQIQIQKTSDIKLASDSFPYIRRGAQKIKVTTPSAIKQLEYTKGLSSFEAEVIAVEPDLVTNSIPIIEFMLHVVPTAEPSQWLSKQQLLKNGKPTVSAVLLFAEEPQSILPKRCGIKVYRYKTKDDAGSRETLAFDPITIEGSSYSQILSSVEATTKIIEEMKKLGDENLEGITYPQETLHEIITNAVIHRDYSLADDIHIRIFDNRVEIESPGRLPAHITVKNILEERFARNPAIVRLLNKYPNPPNKDVGEGLNTAFSAMRKLGLKAPVIEERDNSVLIQIRHEPLASPEVIILSYLEDHETIRNKTAREICNISGDYIVKEMFNRLAARGLIERVPGTRTSSTAYRKGLKFSTWRGEENNNGNRI
jgi:ATP-dependent DNA helicase RecG